jgi:hypothetical protein
MKQLSEYSVAELQRVIVIREKLDSLQSQLTSIIGNDTQDGDGESVAPAPGKRKLSAAHRRKLIKALAKARRIRWAKAKAAGTAKAPKQRRMSAAGRAAIAAAAKARWARFRAAKA